MTSAYLPSTVGGGDLVAELASIAPQAGPNTGLWPGLTIYRFTAPAGPTWEEIQSLSLCVVAQGRKAVTVDGETYMYDPFRYLVLSSHLHFQAEILEATIGRPFLSLVLQIEPDLVRQVSSDMLERRTTVFRSREAEAGARPPDACVSALDQELLGVVLRFLRAVKTTADRRVLAPLYLQELVYRVLQREQYARLLALAAAQSASNPVSAVLEYMRAHLYESLTVADLADLVSLSPSAFAHLFRDVTGRSPYQFLKEMRLDRARELLVDGHLTVARISKEVGYASVSHFISEFRGRFGRRRAPTRPARLRRRLPRRLAMDSGLAARRHHRQRPRTAARHRLHRLIRTSESLARADRGGDGVPRRGQRALPRVVIPAGRVIQEVQVDDQAAVRSAQVRALGGVQRVPAAAVAGLARGAVAQWQQQAAGVLAQPPDVETASSGAGSRKQPMRSTGDPVAGRHRQRTVPCRPGSAATRNAGRVVGPVRQARRTQRIARRQRALRMRPEQPFRPCLHSSCACSGSSSARTAA